MLPACKVERSPGQESIPSKVIIQEGHNCVQVLRVQNASDCVWWAWYHPVGRESD